MNKSEAMALTRQYILESIAQKQASNPKYSLRAFAKAAHINPSGLSQFLRGNKKGLAIETLNKVLPLCDIPPAKMKSILLGVADNTPSTLNEAEAFRYLSKAELDLISGWEHYAILNLLETENFNSTISYIQKRLRLNLIAAQNAVENLNFLGLIEKSKDGKWSKTENYIATTSHIPSAVIKKMHSQYLEKSRESIALPKERRDFSAVQMALDPAQINELKKFIKDFRRKFLSETQKGPKKTEVYSLNIQFIPLTTPEDSQ